MPGTFQGRQVAGGRRIVAPDTVAKMSLEDMRTALLDHNVHCPACKQPGRGIVHGRRPALQHALHYISWPNESIQNDNTVYLRPETAQGAYINFSQIVKSLRKRVPFGIGQIGKAFRNEIHPSNFLFRTREFELLELQYFTHPENATKEYERWREYCLAWLRKYGIDDQNLRFRDYGADEVAHYARATTDIEYNFPSLGWSELWGIADRGDFDLKQHPRHFRRRGQQRQQQEKEKEAAKIQLQRRDLRRPLDERKLRPVHY